MKRYALVTIFTVAGSLFAPSIKVESSKVFSADVTSPWTDRAVVTVWEVTPPTPTNCVGTDIGNGRDVLVTWECPASPLITGFQIERERQVSPPDATNPDGVWGESSMVDVLDPLLRQYMDPAGVGTWRYRVRSVNNRVP